ncbi:ParA family protein [Candidatus Parcubacteria bacterium]|nr:ParA family protein [Candidatus Parcubacteria bacterium]
MIEKKYFTSSDIKKIYRLDERYKTIQTVYKAEERGEIPKAKRISRGKVQVRNWSIDQLPEIGRRFGFLNPPNKQHILCKYIQKGGVLKTTTSFYEAKTLALNGIKTLVIGLDFECSITDVIIPKTEILTLEEDKSLLGLYHFFAEGAKLSEVIKKTSLPTLDIIPETHDLVVLDKWMNHQTRREYIFRDKLIPLLSEYEVIIFDNGTSWNNLIENSLTASTTAILPLGCNLLAYNASKTNLSSLFEFQEKMDLKAQSVIMIPTLLERSTLSQQIYTQYLISFSDYIIPIPIRSSVKGQEALMLKQTPLEYSPLSSSISQDYYELINMLWGKVTKGEYRDIKNLDKKLTSEV